MKKSIRLLYWLPRLICILAILFISLFAIDSFEPELSVRQQLIGFAIHLIPSFCLLILLFIAWKWELIGGVLFMIVGLGFSPFIFTHNYAMNHSIWISMSIILMITFPFIVVGFLFILNYFFAKKNLKQSE